MCMATSVEALATKQSYYDVLGVSKDADDRTIKKALMSIACLMKTSASTERVSDIYMYNIYTCEVKHPEISGRRPVLSEKCPFRHP